MSDNVYLQINGVTLNGTVDGGTVNEKNCTPIIFINSLGSDLRIWDAVIRSLNQSPIAASHQLLRYDKRGHGLSDCPSPPYALRDHTDDLAGLIKALGFDEVILAGISIGGMIAMDYTTRHPEKVKALVLCDTAPKIGSAAGWNVRIQTLRAHGMPYLVDAILSRWFAPDFKQQFPAAFNIFRNMLVRTPLAGYTGSCEAIRDADLTGVVADIPQPTLVLCGEDDLATTPAVCEALSDAMQHARFEIIPDAGHLPCIEQPARFASLLLTFLQTLNQSCP